MGRLDGKVVFVTGAARGLGRSHAVRLAQEGADVIAADACAPVEAAPYAMSTAGDLRETVRLVEALGRRVVAHEVDVRDRDALRDVVDEGVARLGRLDIVLANVGLTGFGSVNDLSPTDWGDVIDVNLTGTWNTCHVAVPHLDATGDGGSIVITNSVAGLHVFPNMPHYVTAKHGLVGMMKALAVELGRRRIRVNSVHPTQVNTPMIANAAMLKAFRPDLDDATMADVVDAGKALHVLPEPWVEAVDVSNAILFLVSDDARCITGASLPVDLGSDLIG